MLLNFVVYCNASEAHAEDVTVKTLTFAPDENGSFEWTTPVGGMRLDDTRVLPTGQLSEWFDLGDDAAVRWRREFICPRCGDAVVARDEKFRPIVDRLLAHGVPRLSLAGLRHTLSA